MSTDPDVDDLLGALRADLPTAEDGARVRSRLVAAGVLAAAATAGSAAGAATLAAQGLTLGARVAALSFGTKLAVATAVSVSVGAATVAALRPNVDSAPGPAASVARAATSGNVTVAAKTTRSEPPAAPAEPSAASADAATPNEPRAASADAATPNEPRAASADAATSNEPSSLAPGRSSAKRDVVAVPVPPSARKVPAVTETRAATSAPTSPSVAASENAATPSALGFPTDVASNQGLNTATLREERALVDAALIALQAGDYPRARSLLDAHGERFPNGLLRLERERARAKLTALSERRR